MGILNALILIGYGASAAAVGLIIGIGLAFTF